MRYVVSRVVVVMDELLAAYQQRFQAEYAAVLDEAFLDSNGPPAIHPLRGEWVQLRRELVELLEVHAHYRSALAQAEAEIIGNPAKVEEFFTLPARAMAWDRSLEQAIKERIQKLPKFTRLAIFLMNNKAPKAGGK